MAEGCVRLVKGNGMKHAVNLGPAETLGGRSMDLKNNRVAKK